MKVLLINASSEEKRNVEQHLQLSHPVGVLGDVVPHGSWPLGVMFFKPGMDHAEEVRAVREKIGASTVLVGVGASDPQDQATLIEAGLDDLSDSLPAFLIRYPFFAARLRQRARRQLRLEAIMDNTVDGIVVIDEAGTVQSVNRAVEQLFGFVPAEVIGRNVSMLMPSPDRERHDGYIRRYLETKDPRIIGIGREVVGKRKDGSLFPLDLAVSEVQIEGVSLFAGVVRDVSERRRLESEVLKVSEEERRRIGRDLHDGLGQMLTGIGLIARNVAARLTEAGNQAADDVAEIAELVRDADGQARALAQGLVPVELDRNGLAAALERLCGQAERLFGGSCTFRRDEDVPLDHEAFGVNLYRIAQEAVSNAFKHGRADAVEVSVDREGDFARLRVVDNGIGYDRSAKSSGMGVRIMHYRAGVIGGQLHIDRLPNGGTVVSCDIPIESEPAPLR